MGVDIRYGADIQGRDLHVESLYAEEITPMVSPAVKANLNIRTPGDLVKHDLIASEITLIQWPHWFAAHGVPESPSSYILSFDRTSMVLDAAIQGLGIALDSHRTAQRALRDGQLVPVFEDRKGIPVRAHHLVYPRAHSQWEKVEKFRLWLRDEASKS